MAEPLPKALSDDLARVRSVLSRELETISHYEQLAHEAQAPELKAFFSHLAFEEKEHVAEATFLLRKLDPGQAQQFDKGVPPQHFEGAAPEAPAEASLIVPEPAETPHPEPQKMMYGVASLTPPSAGPFTVGPLKRRGG